MFRYTRYGLLFVAIAIVAGSALWQPVTASRQSGRRNTAVACSIDVVVETRAQDGTILSTESYVRDFVVSETEAFVDDFSTRIRFKEFSASLQRVNGEIVVAVDWFADISTFNAVDFSTALVLGNGRNSGEIAATHKFYSTPGLTTTRYILSGTRM
ncbi:MAG: hypothetical protein R3C19_04230 [Planctomycetaceae bacterium]